MEKKIGKKRSIRNGLLVYILIGIIVAFLGSMLIGKTTNYFQDIFQATYINEEKIEFELESIPDNNGNKAQYDMVYSPQYLKNPKHKFIYNVISGSQIVLVPAWCILCFVYLINHFYKKKIRKPLDMLVHASGKISQNDLDFNVSVINQDELGLLCSAFEKMRISLQDNNIEMWRQIEERKRLNAAFSHDLRTPLTVLKGQSEMMIKYADQMPVEKIVATSEVMQRHIVRLESYVNTMNDIQRLEDIEVDRQLINVDDVIKQMKTTGISICKDIECIFQDITISVDNMNLDFSIIMRVYENILSNAIRFAKDKIKICIDVKDDYFSVTIADDGKGFSAKDLSEATKPFYKAVNETDNEHFGMGLNICKILCEKHGGYLKLSNKNGATVTVVFKQ